MAYPYVTRKGYSFGVYPVAMIGDAFKNVTLLSILDPQTASLEMDIHAKHAQVYPYLPTGTPNDPTMYDYLKVRTVDGATTIIGMSWVREETVEETSIVTIVVRVTGNITPADAAGIRHALVSNDYNQLEISVLGLT